MRRRPGRLGLTATVAGGLLLGAGGLLAGPGASAAPAAGLVLPRLSPTVTAPVFDGDAPDPDVIRVGTTYYAYTTGSHQGHIPVLSSTDLQTWHPAGDALPTLPSWS